VELAPPMRGGPENFSRAPISNHQTSKYNRFGSRRQTFCGCFEFEVRKVELDPQHVEDPRIRLGP
jgi:hypothetical protein